MAAIQLLLADDEPFIRLAYKDGLERAGYAVETAENGEEALAIFQREHFDICVFDVMMPKMDGFTLAEKIIKINSEVPFVFLTARKLKEDRTEALEIKDYNADGKEVTVGATALENSPEAATKYVIGTEQGTIIVANKKPKRPL